MKLIDQSLSSFGTPKTSNEDEVKAQMAVDQFKVVLDLCWSFLVLAS
jgi:hypothetical protein